MFLVYFEDMKIILNFDGYSARSEVEAWSGRGNEVVGEVVAKGGDLLFLGTSRSTDLYVAGQLASPATS
ncbi:hypothetical protein CsSME_00040547 [Camellia sinensis var. sinensis]